MIEILPGLMPRVIERIKKSVRCQVIAGGLISEKEDIVVALKAGAVAISTTDKMYGKCKKIDSFCLLCFRKVRYIIFHTERML